MFVVVQKHLQNSRFASMRLHGCSPLFIWVGVLLVYKSGALGTRFVIDFKFL